MESRGYAFVTTKDGRPVPASSGAAGKGYLVTRRGGGPVAVLRDLRLDERSDKQRRLVLQEVQMLASLDHPNIVRLHDHWEQDNVVTLVLEFVGEGTLRQSVLRQRAAFAATGCGFLEVHILTWAVQLLLALDYMHSLPYLHRDLKSDNVYVTSDNVIKLGDFGLAAGGFARDASLSVRPLPHATAPEIFQNAPYSPKSDMWSLGCLVYELAALSRPFEASDVNELIRRILKAEAPELGPQYTNDLRILVALLLQKAPEERPSASDVLHMWMVKRHLQGFKRRLQEQATLATRRGSALGPPETLPIHPPKARRTSRPLPMDDEDRLGGRLARHQSEDREGSKPLGADPVTSPVTPKANVVNLGTDRRRMKAFLRGPAPGDLSAGLDAPSLHAFLEAAPQRTPSGQPAGVRRRSDMPPSPHVSFGEVRFSSEGTAADHRSILHRLVQLYSTPASPGSPHDGPAGDVPEEVEPGPDPFARERPMALRIPSVGDDPPSPCPEVPEGRQPTSDAEGVEGSADQWDGDSDVRCASPQSRIDDVVEDMAPDTGDENDSAGGQEVEDEVPDSYSRPGSFSGGGASSSLLARP